MAVKKTGLGKGLGKGLDTMIPVYAGKTRSIPKKDSSAEQNAPESVKKTVNQENINPSEEIYLDIHEVEPNRNQPRRQFEEESLNELAESVKKFGIIQPLIVQKKDNYYEIIAGERRWRAAKIAGLKKVPVIIKEYSKQEAMEISLIENIQREDLNPIEEAAAFQKLIKEFGLKQEELAQRVSKSRTAITNSMRLLKLCEKVQQMVVNGQLSTGHARALVTIEEEEMQILLAKRIVEEQLSVREVEKIMQDLQKPKKEKKTAKKEDVYDYIYQDMAERMKTILGTKVSVNPKNSQKGKIEIEYYSSEELERIFDLFRSIQNR